METQTLRDLAREYAKGTLDRDSYRRHRTELIDGILAGTVQVSAIEFAAPVMAKSAMDNTSPGKRKRQAEATAAELDELDVFDITQVVPPSDDSTPPRPERAAAPSRPVTAPENANHNLPLLVVGIIAIIAIVAVIALVIVFAGRKDVPPAAANPASETTAMPAAGAESDAAAAAATATVSNSATDALMEFLQAKNWSDESLDQFQSRWLSLPQAERDAAASSGEFLQMANAAARKLLEIRALSQVTDAATSQQKEERLLNFARTLGIIDSRLTPQATADTSASQ